MRKVLFPIGDATETVDMLYPYLRVQEDGFEPVVAAPKKQKVNMVLHEVKAGWSNTREYEGYTIDADITFDEIVANEYVGLMLAGGRAPEYIRYDKSVVKAVQHFFIQNKPVGCVCHGIELPAYADVLKGRRVTTVPKCRFDVEVCGGIYVDEPCVVDGNLVSWPTWNEYGHGMPHFIELLKQQSARK